MQNHTLLSKKLLCEQNGKNNRIFFNKNPFPKGLQINKFIWSAHLEFGDNDKEAGLYFDFHLETDGYDELEDFEPETDWIAKIALLYAGEESLDYEFSAFINNVKFDGIYFSDKINIDESLKNFQLIWRILIILN